MHIEMVTMTTGYGQLHGKCPKANPAHAQMNQHTLLRIPCCIQMHTRIHMHAHTRGDSHWQPSTSILTNIIKGWLAAMQERKRERQRERKRDRQRERQTDRQTETERDSDRERKRGKTLTIKTTQRMEDPSSLLSSSYIHLHSHPSKGLVPLVTGAQFNEIPTYKAKDHPDTNNLVIN